MRLLPLIRLMFPLLVSIILSGCVTGRVVSEQIVVQPETLAEAQKYVDRTMDYHAIVYRLSTSKINKECADTGNAYRPPFSLLHNWSGFKNESLRTAIYRVSGANERPVLLAYTDELKPFQGKRLKAVNGTDSGNLGKLHRTIWNDSIDNDELELEFEDGQTITAKPIFACASLIVPIDFGEIKAPANLGNYGEEIPKEWLDVAQNENERAFVLGRSIYFTGGEGRDKLANALIMGAAPNGILKGLTLGLSEMVVDMKVVTLNYRRKLNRSEADVFSIKAMAAAGYDPNAALAFASRSMQGQSWPESAEELKFDEERLAALKAAISMLETQHSIPEPPLPSGVDIQAVPDLSQQTNVSTAND